jgi:oxygen-dependent protoporphyrinogen oxidase
MDDKVKIAIIGGGIAGLSSAYYLNRLASQKGKQIEIVLLEGADYWGGKIKTVTEKGCTIEGGPDSYLVTKPWMNDLVRELEMEDDLQGTNSEFSNTYILHRGQLTPLPTGLTMTIPTELGPILKTELLTWPQKFRMGLDLFLPPSQKKTDESLAGFISRRLGRAAYNRLVGPLLSGIYAGDGDRLSVQATFPILRELELNHGGLIKGALALKLERLAMRKKQLTGLQESKQQPPAIFVSPKGGLVTIVHALLSKLRRAGVELRLNSRVSGITQQGSRFHLELPDNSDLIVDGVVVATPAHIAGQLLSSVDSNLAKDLKKVEYVTTATVSLAYQKDELPTKLEGYGYIVPQQEESRALACTWTSSKWRGRSPEHIALLRVFIGRIQDAMTLPRGEKALIALAREELRKTMKITAEPIANWVFRWEQAMPQYNLGHPDRLDRIEAALAKHPGIALAGNAYFGIGLPDCVRSGIEAAQKLVRLDKKTKYETTTIA